MYMEDPFDQFCRMLVAFVCFVGAILWLELQFLWSELKYSLKYLCFFRFISKCVACGHVSLSGSCFVGF